MKILSIDVGIKNLGYCLFFLNDTHKFEIDSWDVLNIGQDTKIPNCCCDNPIISPISGNAMIANKLSKKTIVIDDASSSFFDFMIGAKAAIAVPPHIAVPEIRRSKCFLSIFINDPSKKPRIITVITYREIKGK